MRVYVLSSSSMIAGMCVCVMCSVLTAILVRTSAPSGRPGRGGRANTLVHIW